MTLKNLDNCPFCSGIVSVSIGLGGDYLFKHKPKRPCPVKNSVRFSTQEEAVKFWKKAAKPKECKACIEKDKKIRSLKVIVKSMYEFVQVIQKISRKCGFDEINRISGNAMRKLEDVG